MTKMFNPDTIDTFKQIKATFDPMLQINEGKLIPSHRISIEIIEPIGRNSPGGAL